MSMQLKGNRPKPELCRYLDYRAFNYANYEDDADTLIVEGAGRDLYMVDAG